MSRVGPATVGLALAVGLVASFLVASPVRAATPQFGEPTIDGSFQTGLVATQPVTLDGAPDRVEVLVTTADSPAPLVAEVAVPSDGGAATLRHRLGGAGDHILPNTPVRVRWRITTDGVATLGPEVRTVVRDDRFQWRTVEGDIVRVHWYEGSQEFAERALRIGERAVEETTLLFGVTEEEPVDFFIYADRDEFYDALGPGTRENVGGQANADIRTLFAQIAPSSIDDAWVANVVPHELIHLVFDTAVKNPYHFPPRWLNEGLASYLGVGYQASDRAAVEAAARSGDLIPLDGLTGQFPTSLGRFGLAYSESASAIDFLIRRHGQESMVTLVRSYAGGRTDDEAFQAAIGMDVAAFNEAWLADLGARPPVRYGPQPPPEGPLPSGWEGPSATPEPGVVVPPSAASGASPSPTTVDGERPADDQRPAVLVVAGMLVVAGIALLVRSRARLGGRAS